MSEISARYCTVADAFSVRVKGIAPERWSAATPCSDWTVRDLIAHVIGTQRRAIARLDGSEPVEVDLAGDLLQQWLAASGAISEQCHQGGAR